MARKPWKLWTNIQRQYWYETRDDFLKKDELLRQEKILFVEPSEAVNYTKNFTSSGNN